MKTVKISMLVLLCLALTLPATGTSSLRGSILQFIPESAGQVAYVDMREVQSSPHYAQLRERVIPQRFADFESFVSRIGVDINTDIDWLAWGLMAVDDEGGDEYFFGIVQGAFSEIDARNYYAENELPIVEHRAQSLFLFGDSDSPGTFAFSMMDMTTGVFGSRAAIELMIDTRDGLNPNVTRNKLLADGIREVNGRAPVWVAMDSRYTQLALSQLLPAMAEFEQFDQVASGFKASRVRVTIGREASLQLEVQCGTASDAQVLAFVLQTGLDAQGWEAEAEAPELIQVLNRADIRSSGDRLRVSLLARESELVALLSKDIKLFP